jgi:hypothetical protein
MNTMYRSKNSRQSLRACTFLRGLSALCVAAALCATLMQGCSKGDTGPAGPAGPSLTGKLIGYVSLVDEFGAGLTDRSGVAVQAGSTSATTDSAGRYELMNLSTGTYNIIFSRNGFGTVQQQGVQFLGGSNPAFNDAVEMSQLSSTMVTGISISITGTGIDAQVRVSGTIDPAPSADFRRGVRLYAGRNASVSPTNYIYSSYFESLVTPFSRILFYSSPQEAGFPSGSTLYVAAYGESVSDYGWFDISTGLMIYPALNGNKSNVATAIIP